MRKYAVPCIISLLVGALYNIVDQIFIANITNTDAIINLNSTKLIFSYGVLLNADAQTLNGNVTGDSYVTTITDEDEDFSNIISKGHTIYYNKSDSRNSSLGGKTIALSDG